MKKLSKLLLSLVLVVTLTGCGNMDNTPTKKVEAFFDKYQTLDSNVLNDLDLTIADDTSIDEASRSEYRDFMKKHYQDLEYKIKDEKIDGDKATVTTEVTVRDYSKVLGDADTYKETNAKEFNDETGNYSAGLFSKYRLTKLKDVTEKKTYTLEITLTKKDGEWIMDELSETDEQKINGLYNDGTNIGSNINEADDNKLNDNLDTDKDNEENQNDNPLMNDQRDSDDTKNEADDNSILE